MNKKTLALAIMTLGAIALLGGTTAFAANKIGTVTGKDGDVKDKIQMSAEITSENGSHVTIKDTDTGKEYETSIGPSWYSGTYNTGDKVTIEGIETISNNENNHNFQITKINDKTLRESFEGKPAWAGANDQQEGTKSGKGNYGHGNGQNYKDIDNDGKCDNSQ